MRKSSGAFYILFPVGFQGMNAKFPLSHEQRKSELFQARHTGSTFCDVTQ
jgi:hypothetical protein